MHNNYVLYLKEPGKPQAGAAADAPKAAGEESPGGVLGSTLFVLLIMTVCTSIFLMMAYLLESGKRDGDTREDRAEGADTSGTAASSESSKKED